MKKLASILLFMFPLCCSGALQSTIQWDVRTTGADTNGGGFDPSVAIPGQDYSQQNSAQVAFTDLVVGGVTTHVTSVNNPFATCTAGSGYCGNIIQVTGTVSGSCTAGFYEVFSTTTITATLDRAPGTAASVCNANLGGALLTPNEVLNLAAVTSNLIWIKSGTYTSASTINVNGNNFGYGVITGYGTTHGDNGTAPLITTASNVDLFTWNNPGATSGQEIFKNLSFSTTSGTKANGMSANTAGYFTNLVLINDTFDGFNNAVYGGGTFYFYGLQAYNTVFKNTVARAIDQNTGPQATNIIQNCFFSNIGSDAIRFHAGLSNANLIVRNNIFSSVTGVGISSTSSSPLYMDIENNDFLTTTGNSITINTLSLLTMLTVANNIFWGSSGSAVAITTSNGVIVTNQHNAYGSNTSGNVNFPAGTGDVAITANPYTSSSNFALNSNAAGGALLKSQPLTGVQGTVGYPDIGGYQSLGSSGGGNYGSSN